MTGFLFEWPRTLSQTPSIENNFTKTACVLNDMDNNTVKFIRNNNITNDIVIDLSNQRYCCT